MAKWKAGSCLVAAVGIACFAVAVVPARAQSSFAETQRAKAAADLSAASSGAADEAKTMPDPAAIVKKYEVAMGGREAWSHFNTRYMKGIYQTEDQSAFAAVEIYSEAPNLRYMKIAGANGVAVREVCNGKTGWLETPRGDLLELKGAALVAWVHDAEFNRGATLLLDLPPGKTVGTAQVGKYSTYVLDFQPTKNISSKVYFDSASGFVVRVDDTVHLADGDYAVQTFLDDYRQVDGVYFAFKYKHVEKGNVFTVRFTKVENNAAVDSSLFTKPDAVMVTR
jgi:outer membrane lipoprotein-sorting protein